MFPHTLAFHLLLVVGVGVRIIMKRPPPGVALAWLFLVVLLPLLGVLLYLLFGERRIDPRRAREIIALQHDYRRLLGSSSAWPGTSIDWRHHVSAAETLHKLGVNLVGSSAVAGSAYVLFDNADDVLEAIARDVDAANTSIVMVFYIWNAGGKADEVLEAVMRAAGRGVSCRILVDALGGRPWWRGDQPRRLRAAGVDLRPALPVGVLRSMIGRADLRLHRKIAIIDGEVAWTGSMNLVDPRFFMQDVGVGEWVDAMVRLEGPVVAPLAATAIGDWMLETGEPLDQLIKSAGLHLTSPKGATDALVIPTGPGASGDALLQMLLWLLNAAQKEIVITTPYLVPDASIEGALRSAAGRGVEVTIVVPAQVDSVLTRYASWSYYTDLLDVGVSIQLYQDGLLHTKSITVDRSISMFGTVNFDMRSLWLNYEITLFVFDQDFATELHGLQERYIFNCKQLEGDSWSQRSFGRRLVENTARLLSPLL